MPINFRKLAIESEKLVKSGASSYKMKKELKKSGFYTDTVETFVDNLVAQGIVKEEKQTQEIKLKQIDKMGHKRLIKKSDELIKQGATADEIKKELLKITKNAAVVDSYVNTLVAQGKIKEETQEQGQKTQIPKEKDNLLNEHIQKLDSRIELLEKAIEEQKSMPKEINSDDCFETFKKQKVEMCLEKSGRSIDHVKPTFVIAKSDSCIEGDIFSICIEEFKEEGIVVCGEMPEHKMFE